MSTVIRELQIWANQLEYWKRFALDKLIGGSRASDFTDKEYDLMVKYLLQDENLTEVDDEVERAVIEFTIAEDSEESASLTRLVSLTDLKNVNALVDGQRLIFGPHLTAIFGNNGAGKSGYARVLGCAGFTRGAYEVLTDVLRTDDEVNEPEALITISDGDSEIPLRYTKGKKFVELSSSYIFDTDNVRTLLTKENKLNFSPSGVFPLTELVIVVDEVKERLQKIIEKKDKPHNLRAFFRGESLVSQQIENLSRNTDLVTLQGLANVADEDEKRIDQLDREIAILKAREVEQEIKKIEAIIEDLSILHKHLVDANTSLGSSLLNDITDAVTNYHITEKETTQAGLTQFRTGHFSQVGTPVWYEFVTSAHNLALIENRNGNPYPYHDDFCLLCNQPLSSDAHHRMHLIWQFLEAGVEKRFEDARSKVESVRRVVAGIELDFFDRDSVYIHHIAELEPELVPIIQVYIGTARLRRDALDATLNELKLKDIPELGENPATRIQEQIERLVTKKDQLQKENVGEKIAKLSEEVLVLQHRLTLKEKWPEIESYIQNQKWVHQATSLLPSTNAITKKHNQLLDQLVNKNYVARFENNLKDLGCPLTVTVQTRGRKGTAFKQIIIGSTHPEAKPDKILSEGEKRAVAMADFLTEVALDENCRCVIFDDPVTSLDVEWKDIFARRIASEAQSYQVIVFTHDLHFLHLLSQHATETGIDIAFHWVERGPHDNRPGYIRQDNSPLTEQHYRKADKAKGWLEQAKAAQPADREIFLQQGFGALRTTYEVFIMKTMFKEVVTRWSERVMFTKISEIKWDHDIAQAVVQKCELCSRYMEGHSHSDEYSALKPTPEVLEAEIEAFEEINRQWRKVQRGA